MAPATKVSTSPTGGPPSAQPDADRPRGDDPGRDERGEDRDAEDRRLEPDLLDEAADHRDPGRLGDDDQHDRDEFQDASVRRRAAAAVADRSAVVSTVVAPIGTLSGPLTPRPRAAPPSATDRRAGRSGPSARPSGPAPRRPVRSGRT